MVKVFDLDGTILDSNGVWRKVDEAFVARRGLELTSEYTEFLSHAIFPVAAKFTKEYYSLPDSEQEIMDEWYSLAYHAYAHELPLKAHVKAYLEQCARNRERMVVYTSGVPALCKAALERHELLPLFEGLYFAQDLNLEKKFSASFVKLAELLGESPGNCVLFDDSPYACRSARDAGWRVIGIEEPIFSHHKNEMKQICHSYISGFENFIAL